MIMIMIIMIIIISSKNNINNNNINNCKSNIKFTGNNGEYKQCIY